jgi:uncharacterized protein YuzE
MNDFEKIVGSMLTKQRAEHFMNYLESKGYSASGFGEYAANFGLSGDDIDNFKEMKTKQILDFLKDSFSKFKFVSITLAFEPSNKFLQNIKVWLEKNMEEKVLVDLTINRKIIGGAVVIANNRYKDYSISSKIKHTAES